MCLLLLAYDTHRRYSLVVVANRDEFYRRPAEQAHAWNDGFGTFAGVDREASGTWLGITSAGRFAALTNYRDAREMRPPSPDEPSRGGLVRGFLQSDDRPEDY